MDDMVRMEIYMLYGMLVIYIHSIHDTSCISTHMSSHGPTQGIPSRGGKMGGSSAITYSYTFHIHYP